jgi:PAS domain S-box-containing protein
MGLNIILPTSPPRFAHYLFCYNFNMTDLEPGKELRDMQDKLITSELRYRKLFETAKDAILLIDPLTEQIIDANPFLLGMIGYSLADVVGKKLWEIGAIKDIEATKALFKTLQETGYAHYEGLPLQSEDGKKHEVEFVSNKYRLNGHMMIQCNIRDITDRVASEKKAATYLKQLEETNKSMVGRELKMAELKKENEKLEKENKEFKEKLSQKK